MDRPDEPGITNPFSRTFLSPSPDSGVSSAVAGHLQVRGSNMYSYEGDVTVYRQELLTSSERNPATGKYDVEWHYVKDATCPLYSDNTGTSYIKYKGEYCQVFNINQEMFPDEWSNGFTKAVDTKGKYNLVLR